MAENTVDAVIAPACWAALAGAPGAFGYRAVNTLDAMVGHRTERYLQFGWASARLDDVANWIPARLTAILVAVVRPSAARRVLTALRYPPPHPSPNAERPRLIVLRARPCPQVVRVKWQGSQDWSCFPPSDLLSRPRVTRDG